jgi:AP-1 complex subunit beta-1
MSHPLQELCYLSIKFVNEVVALIELTLKGRGIAQLAIKTIVPEVVAGVQLSIQQILASDSDA